MYDINDKITQSVAEAVKTVIENKEGFKPHTMYDPKTGKGYEAKTYEDHLKMKDMGYTHEKPSEKNETEVQDSDKDFVDTHTVDAEEDPEQKRQVEETEVEDEDEDDVEEGNAFGQAVTDAKKAGKKKFKFQGKEYKVESAELEEGVLSNLVKSIGQKFNDAAVKKIIKAINSSTTLQVIVELDKFSPKKRSDLHSAIADWLERNPSDASAKNLKRIKSSLAESTELEEAIDPRRFVLGGDAKVTSREVDGMLSKLFIDAKLAKAVEANAAYQDGYKGKVKKNPFDKDTADFHLFILGQQSASAE